MIYSVDIATLAHPRLLTYVCIRKSVSDLITSFSFKSTTMHTAQYFYGTKENEEKENSI